MQVCHYNNNVRNLSDCLNIILHTLILVAQKWGGRSLPSLPYSYGPGPFFDSQAQNSIHSVSHERKAPTRINFGFVPPSPNENIHLGAYKKCLSYSKIIGT